MTEAEQKENNIKINLFRDVEIDYENYKILDNEYYKYIESIVIHGNYNLNSEQIALPFELEKEESKKEKGKMKAQF